MNRLLTCLALPAAASLFAATAHAETIIFKELFDGSSATDLNDTAPDIGGVNWVAHTGYKADGTTTTQSSATLAFTPVDDTIYQLDATITNNSTTGNWIGVGFAKGQSTNSGTGTRFTAGEVVGRGWTLFRNGDGLINGDGARNTFIGTSTGTGQEWINLTGDLGNTIDIRMILSDAVVGAGVDWQIDYYAKLPASSSYTQIRAATGDVGDDITSVGFTNNGTPGDLGFFQLTIVPEPSSLALLALGGLCLARRRRA